VNDRHEVLEDAQFWLMLEYGMSGWFRDCGDKALGGFWCDGFTPVSARDTREGVEVSGIAWIVKGRESQDKFSFIASIPQRMLGGRRADATIGDLTIDLASRELRVSVVPASKSPNKSLERTRGR
jgi:hypothetical protein